MEILVLNAGSSSLKSTLYDLTAPLPAEPPKPVWEGKIEWGDAAPLRAHGAEAPRGDSPARSHREATAHLLGRLWSARAGSQSLSIAVVGHRVVHGGWEYIRPTVITPEVKAGIRRLAEFAPLHNPAALEGIEIAESQLPSVPQVAVFDTAFHAHLPALAAIYPGPYEWFEQGIRRYGFHGINHRYCAERAARLLGRDFNTLRLVISHLGNGCSLAAVAGGRSVETTMGFTPLEGLMMGTRSGSVDPGILIHLMRHGGLTAEKLDAVLNQQSGLLGISGISGDMREVLAAMKAGNARARMAFELYSYRLVYYIGAMAAVLGGLDALVFTAGVGENCAELRAATCERLGFLGLAIDPRTNAQPAANRDRDIATGESCARVLVIRAQEDWAIARECFNLMNVPRA